MPKSKRQKVVSLTRTDKKLRDGKDKLFRDVRSALDEFTHVYVIAVENMRNKFLQQLRVDWKPSRFFLGKNTVMSKALGTRPEEAYREGLDVLAAALVGDVGLLCTNSGPAEVEARLAAVAELDYCRAGQPAPRTVTLPAGPCATQYGDPIPHSMEPQLRKLGLPTRLVAGVVHLDRDFTLCSEGERLTPEFAHLLKLFHYAMADFQVEAVGVWTNGAYRSLRAMSADSEGSSDEAAGR